MKKFFEEFKKFITRGNVLDMAVGVIVGGAFTGIVNGLSNFVLKPIINWLLALILGKEGLSGAITPLSMAYMPQDILDAEGNVIGSELVYDLANSIYIDWGSFISAIINFFIIAFVLFSIVKVINSVKDKQTELVSQASGKLTKEDKKELKARGIKRTDKEAVAKYLEEKAKLLEEARLAEEEKQRLEKEANPSVEDLLKQILAQMKKD
ncbi:MAG: large conductance mechanosensitive channel protein MscL [Clostridia bacterium]|nr:large conductance mechanosensitive channel protein MscL [Clostridia bacterium]